MLRAPRDRACGHVQSKTTHPVRLTSAARAATDAIGIRPGPLDVAVDVQPPGPHVAEVDPVPPVEEGLELVEVDVVHGIVGRRGGRRAQAQRGEGEGRADGLAHPRAILP